MYALGELQQVSIDSLVCDITFYTTGSMTTDEIFCKMNLKQEIYGIIVRDNDKGGIWNMAEISEELKKEVQEILDRERWQGYVSGKVEGALNVLYALDLSKEKRLELLSKAVGISHTTAEGFLEPREIEERIYKNENLSDEEKDALDALMSNKTMKDEIEMQREIGKQLFLVSIIHYESDFVRKWGYSFLSRDKLVAWTSTAKEELDHFIDVCGALDPYNMAAEAAKECCRKEPFKSERDAYCFVLFTYYRMGDLFASTMNIDKFEDYCKKFSEHNYKSYSA